MMGGAAKGGLNAMEKGIQEYGKIQRLQSLKRARDYNSAVLAKLSSAQAQKALTGGKD